MCEGWAMTYYIYKRKSGGAVYLVEWQFDQSRANERAKVLRENLGPRGFDIIIRAI